MVSNRKSLVLGGLGFASLIGVSVLYLNDRHSDRMSSDERQFGETRQAVGSLKGDVGDLAQGLDGLIDGQEDFFRMQFERAVKQNYHAALHDSGVAFDMSRSGPVSKLPQHLSQFDNEDGRFYTPKMLAFDLEALNEVWDGYSYDRIRAVGPNDFVRDGRTMIDTSFSVDGYEVEDVVPGKRFDQSFVGYPSSDRWDGHQTEIKKRKGEKIFFSGRFVDPSGFRQVGLYRNGRLIRQSSNLGDPSAVEVSYDVSSHLERFDNNFFFGALSNDGRFVLGPLVQFESYDFAER